MAAAYLTFRKKGSGESLGTYLMSFLLRPQKVVVEGKTYDVALRPKRSYKPYTIHLDEFRHDKYVGTEKPKNYSSQIHLIDASRNEEREVLIYMNHPMRYEGETFTRRIS